MPREETTPISKAQTRLVSPAVSRAMSRFQNRLFEVQHGKVRLARPLRPLYRRQSKTHSPHSTGQRSVGLANRLNVNTLFVAKLRDRQIDPNTMTTGFRKRVADEMNVSD